MLCSTIKYLYISVKNRDLDLGNHQFVIKSELSTLVYNSYYSIGICHLFYVQSF